MAIVPSILKVSQNTLITDPLMAAIQNYSIAILISEEIILVGRIVIFHYMTAEITLHMTPHTGSKINDLRQLQLCLKCVNIPITADHVYTYH